VARVAIAVPVTRAQSLVQTRQTVHAVTANKMTERVLCVEVRLEINFINIYMGGGVLKNFSTFLFKY
jgi:hypothetical protein